MDITIRKGNSGDIEAFITLLADVRAQMEHKEWFYLDSPEDVRAMMAQGIMELWVAEDQGKPVGFFDLLRPGRESFNYGYDLDFSAEELLRVVNMDSAAVHPEYRGRGLQGRLLEAAHRQLKEEGNRILLCTVHPENKFSLNNVLKLGYTIQKRVEKYGSVRYILRKDFL